MNQIYSVIIIIVSRKQTWVFYCPAQLGAGSGVICRPRRLCPKWRDTASGWRRAAGAADGAGGQKRGKERERKRESVLSAPPDARRRDTIVVARLDGRRGVYINRRHVDRPSGLSPVLRYCMHATSCGYARERGGFLVSTCAMFLHCRLR